MSWEVEYTDEFGTWWDELDEAAQDDVAHAVEILAAEGPHTPFPISSAIRASRHQHMRELRIQSSGKPIRVLYAFDPRRCAILLLGGDKTGDDRWYEVNVPIADRLYDEHLASLRREGLIAEP
ncbi:MAG: type II toxin-antitoxin system RelE/ParE family toxin [Longimicrobiales bacterium]